MEEMIMNIFDEEEMYDEDEFEDWDEIVPPSRAFKEQNKLDTKNDVASYELLHPAKLEEGEEPLGKVIGHENQKKELLCVIDWFKRSQELREKGISTPKAVLLFGAYGCGKSLLIKEIIRCCEVPVFVFQGEQANVVEGIVETFKKAREVGKAIIVFDELDLLIDKERRVVRALQENLDGVESGKDDILVLAATNFLGEIPEGLRRHGRFDKLIKIPAPTSEEALKLFKKHYDEFKLPYPSDFDEEEVALSLNGIPCSGIKSVVNDLVLRNGFENITTMMIDKSIYNITDRIKDTPEEDNISIATHEASHACLANAYPEFFKVNRLNISGASGEFHCKEVERGYWPYDKVKAHIKIAMAGLVGQKVICGTGSRGQESDLQEARRSAYNLFNMNGYGGAWRTLPEMRQGARTDTQTKRRNMERKIERYLRKCERETTRYVKKHVDEIKALANLLFEKKHLKSSEILACLG